MKKFEFYVSPEGETRVLAYGEDTPLSEHTNIIDMLYNELEENFSEALKACMAHAESIASLHPNQKVKFLAVDRFIRCNFGARDTMPDILNGKMEFEEVPCHLRGVCLNENVICKPRHSLLRDIEEKCISQLCMGYDYKESAALCCESESSVLHKWKNVCNRLGVQSYSQLTRVFKGLHLERRLGFK